MCLIPQSSDQEDERCTKIMPNSFMATEKEMLTNKFESVANLVSGK